MNKKGYCFINSKYFSPEELFPDHEVIDGDNCKLEALLYKFDDKKRVVVFSKVPPKRVIENLKYPFVIYTVKKPPKWLYEFAQINGRVDISVVLTKLIRGEELSEEETKELMQNCSLAHLILTQNLHLLYDSPPPVFGEIEKYVKSFMSTYYVMMLIEILKLYPPKYYPPLRYVEGRDWRKVKKKGMLGNGNHLLRSKNRGGKI